MENPDTTEAVDLNKLRDDKCVPIARMVLNDLAVGLMPADASKVTESQAQMVMQILQRALDADTNLTTDNPFIFQLVTGALAGLNTTVVGCTVTPVDNVRYATIASKMLGILATANVPMTTLTPEEMETAYAPVKEQLNALFAEEKLNWLEVKYISEGIMNAFQAVENTFNVSLERSVENMEAKILGITTLSDLTMKRLDAELVKPVL